MLKIVKKRCLSFLLLSVCTTPVWAQGLVLNDESLRTDLNWLNQQGVIQISTSTWPLSGDEIQRALASAKVSTATQQKVIQSIQSQLTADNALLKAKLFAESDQKNIPQSFADDQKAQFQAAVELNAGGQNWDARLRVNAEKNRQIENDQTVNVEGSYLAGKLWNQWLIAGQIPTYWGPGHDGSLIRGDASRPVYGFTAQRATQQAFDSKWLSWVGPWQYQAFAGRLDDYRAIPDTNLIGLRLTAQPLPYLELGASRTLQIGGKGQPKSFNAYWNAIIGKDNDCTGGNCVNDKNASNQIAGFDGRLNLQMLMNVPVSLYGQYVGEDEAGLMPSKKMYLAGADYSSSLKDMPYQLYAEWADTRSNGDARGISYNHHNYKDGYYQHGFPLGHTMGGDGQMISAGGSMTINSANRVNGRAIFAKVSENQRSALINVAFPEKDEIKALDLTWTHQLRTDIPVKLNGWLSDSDRRGSDAGVSLGIEFPIH